MARYSLFVLKVPLNTKQESSAAMQQTHTRVLLMMLSLKTLSCIEAVLRVSLSWFWSQSWVVEVLVLGLSTAITR